MAEVKQSIRREKMKSLTALSLSIAVLGAVATFLALQVAGGFVLIW